MSDEQEALAALRRTALEQHETIGRLTRERDIAIARCEDAEETAGRLAASVRREMARLRETNEAQATAIRMWERQSAEMAEDIERLTRELAEARAERDEARRCTETLDAQAAIDDFARWRKEAE